MCNELVITVLNMGLSLDLGLFCVQCRVECRIVVYMLYLAIVSQTKTVQNACTVLNLLLQCLLMVV